MEITDKDRGNIIKNIAIEISHNIADFMEGEIRLNKSNIESLSDLVFLQLFVFSICFSAIISSVSEIYGINKMELYNDVFDDMILPMLTNDLNE